MFNNRFGAGSTPMKTIRRYGFRKYCVKIDKKLQKTAIFT